MLFLINMFEIIKYFTVFLFIFRGKMYKNNRIIFGILALALLLLIQTFGLKSDSAIFSVFAILIILGIIIIGKWKNKVILFLLTWIFINYLDTICYFLMGIAIKKNAIWYYAYNPGDLKLLESIFAELIIIIIAIICRKKAIGNWFERKLQIVQSMLLIGAMLGFYIVLIAFTVFRTYGEPSYQNRLNITLIFFILLTISCILAFFLYSNHLKKENDLKTKNIEVQEENDGLRLALYANMEMMDDDMRQYRHDNRHHRAVLSELASKGDLEEIKDYLAQLSEQDEDLKKKNVLYTGNYMVDAIINGIIAKEAYSDVKFHCEGKLPRKLMIQDVDLSELLSNGLENAAEACLHSNGDKCVLFKAASYENMIHCEIKNTYDSTRYKALSKGDFETTKKDSEYHGYGIESMRRIVKKYDGKLEYIVEPEWVITDIYLQQKDEI